MGALLASGLGGVASLVGDLFGASSAKGQQKFEERMADTTYQRTVADMKKAGLNPMMMMAKGGGPDPMPGGTGVAQGEMYSDAASKAANMALIGAQIAAQNANAQQTRAQTVGLLPAQIAQIQELTRNAALTGRTILPMASSTMELQSVQEELQRAQAGRVHALLPWEIKAGELQPGLVSAQTQEIGRAHV